MRVIDDLDAHVAALHGARRGARRHDVPRAHRRRGERRTSSTSAATPARSSPRSRSRWRREEIGLNEALEAAGIRAVETDLGEYILQLAGEHPVHIVAPAIEKTQEDVAELLSRVEGRAGPGRARGADAAPRGASCARRSSTADVGITGANFGVCRDGLDLSSSRTRATAGSCRALPRVHVALIGHGAARARRSPISPCCCGCSRAAAPGSACRRTRR